MVKANIDVQPGNLRQFAGQQQLKVDVEKLQAFNDAAEFKPNSLPGTQQFAAAVTSSTAELKQFLTAADQGFNAYKAGAAKMADSFDTAEHRVTTTIEQAAPRQTNLPGIDPRLNVLPDRPFDQPPHPIANR